MTKYEEISQEIGWTGKTAEIPTTVSDALGLVDQAINGDLEAFKRLIEINRFADAPKNTEEMEIYDICRIALSQAIPQYEWEINNGQN